MKADVQSISSHVATVRLSTGFKADASVPDGYAPSGSVTVVVRPEHSQLIPKGGALSGVIDNIVFFGTDTHYHLKLPDGTPFIVRQQNTNLAQPLFKQGQTAGISLAPGALRVLRD
jgi:spermidine/putrescine transport system ATP-binding protein